jgi:hypothetical protein
MTVMKPRVRSSRSEPYALRRVPLDESTGDESVKVVALAPGQGGKRRFKDWAYDLVALAEHRLPTRGEPVTDRPPWSRHALDHSVFEKAVGQSAEGLVGLERHLGEGVRRRVRSAGDRTKSVPLGQRRADFSQLAVHAPVMTVLKLLDGSAQVLERDGHAAKIPQ